MHFIDIQKQVETTDESFDINKHKTQCVSFIKVIGELFEELKLAVQRNYPQYENQIKSWQIEELEERLKTIHQLNPSCQKLLDIYNRLNANLKKLQKASKSLADALSRMNQLQEEMTTITKSINNNLQQHLDLKELAKLLMSNFANDCSIVSLERLIAFNHLLTALEKPPFNQATEMQEFNKAMFALSKNELTTILQEHSVDLKKNTELFKRYKNYISIFNRMKYTGLFLIFLAPSFVFLTLWAMEQDFGILLGAVFLDMVIVGAIVATTFFFGPTVLAIAAAGLILAAATIGIPLLLIGYKREKTYEKKIKEVVIVAETVLDKNYIVKPEEIVETRKYNLHSDQTFFNQCPALCKKKQFTQELSTALKKENERMTLG